jgi:hypothetical protein
MAATQNAFSELAARVDRDMAIRGAAAMEGVQSATTGIISLRSQMATVTSDLKRLHDATLLSDRQANVRHQEQIAEIKVSLAHFGAHYAGEQTKHVDQMDLAFGRFMAQAEEHRSSLHALRTLGAGGQATIAARLRLGQLNLHRHQLQSALLRSQRAIRLLQQRGPMLRGVLSLLESKTISTEMLNDEAVEDNLAGLTEPRDGEVMARLNPYASEEEAAARFSNLDGYVSAEHDP